MVFKFLGFSLFSVLITYLLSLSFVYLLNFVVFPSICCFLRIKQNVRPSISSGSSCRLSLRSTTMGKPRGIRCARKLRVHRREALWADKELGHEFASSLNNEELDLSPGLVRSFHAECFLVHFISYMLGKLYLAGLQEGKLGYQVQVQSFRRPTLLVSQVCVTSLCHNSDLSNRTVTDGA